MLKKILSLLAVTLTLGYIIFAILTYSDTHSTVRCKNVNVVIKDSTEHRFIRSSEIQNLLKRENIKLVGKRLKDINYKSVEKIVSSHPLISRAECFACPSGLVTIHVWQQIPILRIMSEYGNFYLNQQGEKTGLSVNSAADVVVATGFIKDSMGLVRLYRMALLLKEDAFWDSQIEQIFVEPNGEWVLIPRVGDYEVLLGLPNNIPGKLQRLRLFYQKALPKVGWERYSKISLKYENQIVCTKKE